MRNPQVHWFEGLFLRPHHFQANDRYWAETLQTSHQWDSPYHYGIQAIEFSKEALGNFRFQVSVLKARMPDGAIIDLDFGQEPDEVDLKDPINDAMQIAAPLEEAFASEAIVRVFLGIPKLRMGRANVSQNGDASAQRYVNSLASMQDESQGGNDQSIEFRWLNARLLLSTQDTSGYDLLPIAQIKRAGEGEASPQLDPTYIPPVLAISSWTGLGRDLIRALYDIIGQKIEVMGQQVINREMRLDRPGDAERILMLNELNAAYATLGVMTAAQGVHPLTAYVELARLVGRLSIFGPDRRTAEVPAYDHEDLYRVFHTIKLRIEELISSVRDYEYQQRYFTGVGMGMQVSLESEWFHSDWQWVIGVNKGGLTHQECLNLLSPGQLDWKLASSREVEMRFKNRMEGLELVPVDRPIRALPASNDWIYFDLRSGSQGWADVQETQTLAMRLKDSLIVNRDRLQGKRQLVVLHDGKPTELEFALFAIPTQS